MVSKLQYNGSNHNLKKTRGLYEIHEAEDAQWEARRQQINTLSSLSLFHQQGTDDKENETTDQIHDSERPTTPINDSIKSAPKTYAGLSKLIHRRINPRPEWTHISVEDQSSLGAVIMGEVNAVWPVLRRQVADPFLTHQQNKELQRRITIHCVTVCEKLFFHYADKIKVLNNRGIFSNPANISRIRAQLALDTGNYLNILSVRRHIITDIKKPLTKEVITFNRDDVTTSPTTPMPPQTPDHLSFHDLVKSSRPRRKMKYQFNLKAEIQNMQSQMPTLSRSKIQQLRPLTERSFVRPKSDEKDQDDEEEEFTMKMKDEEEDNDSLLFASIPRQPKHRCPSEPIAQHDLLLDEMRQREEDEDDILMRSPSLTQQSRQMTHSISPTKMQPEPEIRSATSLGLNKGSQRHSADRDSLDPKADLKLLILKQERDKLREIELDESDTEHPAYDIPPLIQALTRREAQDLKVKTLKVQEKKLDEQYEEEMKERMKPLPVPQYPQPAVVQTKLPGISNPVNRSAITIRTSDVKINDHVDLSAVTLESYLPIYNDLKDDISQATVKELDANLYQGGELREVYSEIMKTVPNIHQHYDNDPLIATPGSDVDLSKILASSTLIRPRSQQVINPRLRKEEHDMPWEGQQMMWMKNNHPQSAYGGSEASSFSQPLGEGVSAFHRFTPSQLNHPGIEKGSRAYASWLQWWKNTINTDDFFKYISTQDTDFLSVLYHFYDSDAADSDTESMRTAKVEAERERNKKLTILKQEKEEFIPGLWNVKSVTFGGLGKDPEIEEEEFSEFGTPQMTDRSLSFSGGEMKSSIETGSPRSTRSRLLKNLNERRKTNPGYEVSFNSSMFEVASSTSASFSFPGEDIEKERTCYIAKSSDVTLTPSTGVKPIKYVVRNHSQDSKQQFKEKRIESVSDKTCLESKKTVSSVQCKDKSFNCTSAVDNESSGYFSYSYEHKSSGTENTDQASDLLEMNQERLSNNFQKNKLQTNKAKFYLIGSSCYEGMRKNKNKSKMKLKSKRERNIPESSRKKSKKLFRNILRAEKPIETTKFLNTLDPYSEISKLLAANSQFNRSGSVRRSSRTHTHTSTTGSKQDTVQEQTLQERLEIVWEKLLMPDSQKLNYALKYSTDKYIKRLVDIVSSWERVTDMILQREKYITNLEIFEKEASDPNRFFEKGHRGSSVMRLNEAKTRASLYKKLEVLESNIKASLLSIKSRFSDEVTYDGRPYLKKMGWDKVEMLYYLQQERRCTMLRDHGRPEQFDLFLHHGQHSTPSILPPTGRRYTQLPINSVNLVVPE